LCFVIIIKDDGGWEKVSITDDLKRGWSRNKTKAHWKE